MDGVARGYEYRLGGHQVYGAVSYVLFFHGGLGVFFLYYKLCVVRFFRGIFGDLIYSVDRPLRPQFIVYLPLPFILISPLTSYGQLNLWTGFTGFTGCKLLFPIL